jgi:hypothetical protein
VSHESPDELEARLLASARGEHASNRAREQTLARMLQKRRQSRRFFRPAALVAVLAAAVGVSLFAYVTQQPEPISAERLPPGTTPSATAALVREPLVPLTPMPDLPRVPERSASRTPPSAASQPARPRSNAASPSLEEETRALQTVQAELRAGRAQQALTALDDYERATRNGRLAAEARILRIQALAASGRAGEASKLAELFLAAYPNSPLGDRARKYLVAPGLGGNGTNGNLGR